MSKLIDRNSLKKLDYEKLGLKSGIEIHQQLNTGKLFCSCPCEIVPNDTLNKEIKRRLRFSLSETGEIDKAAYDEFKKGKFNVYKYNDKIACLVDLDEEPPKGPNRVAFDVVIRMAQLLNIKFFDKIQFMRKLIINGSVTSGYQRTAMVGFGGSIQTSFGEVKIDGVNIEEDACRIIENNGDYNVYALDRQGIPLIEITTGPQITKPEQGLEVAKQLGNLLRSFSQTKRGLGTIRQDINVSIINGARIEIKGAQNLKLIPAIIEDEVRRQLIHISIIDELKGRGVGADNFSDKKIYDITKLFEKSDSKVVKLNLEEKGSAVLAIKLNKFDKILGHEMQEGYRFATEVSDRNKKHFPMIKGLFHSDELPKYGITQEEVDSVRKELKLKEEDSFILIVNKKSVAEKSLKNVLDIIASLIMEVPTEVRQVDPKSTLTTFSRAMPGAARMYPETDIKEIDLTQVYLDEQKKLIPELYDKKIERLKVEWGLDENKINDVLTQFTEPEFNVFLKHDLKPLAIYATIFDLPKEISKREKVDVFSFEHDLLVQIIKMLDDGKLNKNTLYDLYFNLYKDKVNNVEDLDKYAKDKGLFMEEMDEKEIEEQIKEIIKQNEGAPFGALMGHCMKSFNGKVDGKKISMILKKLM